MTKQIIVWLAILLFQSFNLFSSDIIVKEEKVDPITISHLNKLPSESDYDLSIMNLQVDVLGLVFFGPQVSLDFQLANIVAIGPYIRWNYAGFLYQGVITDWFTDESTPSPASYGIGIQAKVLIPIGSGQHRPYVGFGYERFKGEESYDPGGTWGKHIWEYKSNIYHFDLGYRLLTSKSFNLSVGLSLGASIETDNIDYYEFGDDPIDHNILNTRFIGMLQVGLGWQLGK